MTTIYLGGELGQRFGKKWKLRVKSTAEALRLIEANSPGLMAYLVQSGDIGVDFRVRVNGETINEDLVNFGRSNATIRISPVVRGAKSKYFGIIVGVALVALTWGAGAGYFGAYMATLSSTAAFGITGLTYGAIVGGIGISMALGGIAQLLSPSPKGGGGDAADKPSYLFNGAQNTAQQGGPVPLLYGGPIIVGSCLISAGVYTEQLAAANLPSDEDLPGPDPTGEGGFTVEPNLRAYNYENPTNVSLQARELQTLQISRIVDLICEGQIAGICDINGNVLNYNERLKGTFFDRTPVRGIDGALAFNKFATAFRNGTAGQSWMAGFPATEQQVSVNVEVIKGSDKIANAVQRQILSGGYNAVRFQIRIPALYKYDEQGNRSGADVHITIQAKKSTDSTWMEVTGNSVVQSEMDGLIAGQTVDAVVYSYRVPLDGAFTWDVRVIRETDDSADTAKLQNRTIFQGYTLITDYKLRYPHSVVAGTEVSAAKFSDTPERAWRLKGKLVKVPKNYNPDTRNYTGSWDGEFAGCPVILDGAYTAGQTLLNVQALGSTLPDNSPIEFTVGLIKSEAYLIGDHAAGSTVLAITPIPRDLPAALEGYGFILKWTNNPAWVFYDISHNARYGLGRYVPADRIDTASLYTIGRYCDGVDIDGIYVGVDDGNGGVEPRFACNCYIAGVDEAFRVLQDIASTFRGMVFWSTGLISAVQDSPKTPIFQFTDANVIDGSFNYSGSSRKSIHTVAMVSFNSPELFYAQDIETYEDQTLIDRFGIREARVTAFGCTSRSQARRVGKWMIETEKLETQTVTFRTAIQGARARLGDLIRIRDRYKSVNRMGGRISAVDPGVIVLDSEVTLTADAHTIMVDLADGGVRELEVTNGAGLHRLLNVTGDLTGVMPEAVWILRNDNVEPFLARVVELKELEKHVFEITAVEYAASKFAVVEEDATAVEPPTGDLPSTNPPQAVTNLTILERFVITPGGSQRQIYASWSPSASPSILGYRAEFRDPGGSWRIVGDVGMSVSTAGQPVTIQGEYGFRVTAIGYFGVTSAPALAVFVVGDVPAPNPPTSFVATARPEAVELTWVNPTDPDLAAVEIWESLTNVITDATRVQVAMVARYTRVNITAGLQRFYWIRSVNRVARTSTFVGPLAATPENGLASVVTGLGTKNSVFRQATAPTAYAVDDIWFDSDDDNRGYTWNGTTWVASWTPLLRFATGTARVTGLQKADGTDADFVLVSDKFQIWNGTSATAPFLVSGGVVYIQDAMIANASIGTAKIADLAVNAAKIADLSVSTIKIANQAVTIPVSAFTAASIATTSTTFIDLATVSITCTGAPIQVTGTTFATPIGIDLGGGNIIPIAEVCLTRGSTVIARGLYAVACTDAPPAGTYTYKLQGRSLASIYMTTFSNRSIFVMETKK